MNKNITLLFGMPRSGTTWIGKVFDSHPDTLYFHEPDSRNRIKELPVFIKSDDAGHYSRVVNNFVSELSDIRNANVMAKLPLFDKNYLSWTQRYFLQLSMYTAKLTKAEDLFYLPQYQKKSDIFYVWKSIESLGRLYTCLHTSIHYKAIHILRHPCGQIASVLKGESNNKFSGNYQSSEDYPLFEMMLDTETAEKYELSLEKIKQITPVERLAWKWLIYNESAFNDCKEVTQYKIASYEKLCANPLEEYQHLFAHSGLSWDQQTENFLMKSTLKSSDSYYSVYKNPEESANKWKTQLEKDDIDNIMNIIKKSPLIEYIT